jgi:hypothetical protein
MVVTALPNSFSNEFKKKNLQQQLDFVVSIELPLLI